VPMVELAMRVALGEELAAMGWPDGLLPEPPCVAVKAPVFSTAKLRGVDPSLGPFMQSTGEVIGLHPELSVAMAKALAAASLRPPVPLPGADVTVLSIADRDKPWLADLAAALAAAGYRFMATSGTACALRALDHDVSIVSRVAGELEGVPTIVEAIASGAVSLVVNTPSPTSGPVRDAAAIRHAAIAEGVLCLTSIETAVEAARSLDPAVRERMSDVRTIEAWRSRVPVPA